MQQNRERDVWKRVAGSAKGLLQVCTALVAFFADSRTPVPTEYCFCRQHVKKRLQIPLRASIALAVLDRLVRSAHSLTKTSTRSFALRPLSLRMTLGVTKKTDTAESGQTVTLGGYTIKAIKKVGASRTGTFEFICDKTNKDE